MKKQAKMLIKSKDESAHKGEKKHEKHTDSATFTGRVKKMKSKKGK
jgi:hypothetical protein